MNRNLRTAAPMVYAALVVGGFMISSKVGVGISVVGGMLLGALYATTNGDGRGGNSDR
ncbi:hypothetical protein [Kitasatospora azatica]|uniref:hypothetical protein n=1 Tax=Kitasatospora azatica TaxID=58347 RepID=UPI0012F9191A|nr:hypothetical protein [Kitasatospora azatica]